MPLSVPETADRDELGTSSLTAGLVAVGRLDDGASQVTAPPLQSATLTSTGSTWSLLSLSFAGCSSGSPVPAPTFTEVHSDRPAVVGGVDPCGLAVGRGRTCGSERHMKALIGSVSGGPPA
jgi:hypothetical protein